MAAHDSLEITNALVHAYYFARDIEAVLDCVTEDIEWMGTESFDRARGKAELRTLLERDAAAFPAAFAVEVDTPQLQRLGEDAELLTVTGRQAAAPGRSSELNVRATLCCVRTAEGWLVRNVHTSVPNTELENDRLARELDETRRKERALMASIPGGVAIYRVKKSGRVETEFVSDGLARMCGYGSGKEFCDYLRFDAMRNVVEADRARVLAAAERSIESDQPLSVMYHLHVKNGPDVLNRLDANLMAGELGADDAGVLYAVHTVVSEESKQIIRDWHDLRALIDQVPTGIGIYEVTGGVVSQDYMNDAFYTMLGSSREERKEYFGENTMSAAHPEDAPAIQAAIGRLLAGEDKTTVTYRLKVRGGWFWLHLTGSVVERRPGYIKVYAAFADYNSVILAQQEELYSRRTLEIALQSAGILAWRYDCRTHRVTDSGTLGKAYDLPKVIDDMPETILQGGFIAPESRETFRELFRRVDTQSTARADTRARTHDGKHEKWYRHIYTPVFDEKQRYLDTVGIAIDITEQKRKEQQYEEAQQLNRIAAQDALSTVSLNLTRNRVTAYTGNHPSFPNNAPYQTADELLGSVFEHCRDSSELSKFEQVANTTKMIEAFRKGTTHIEIQFHFGDKTKWLRVDYDMLRNPYNGDVEAISSIHDVTAAVRAQLVVRQLVDVDYQSLLLIDADTSLAVPFQTAEDDANLRELITLQASCGSGDAGAAEFLRRHVIPGTEKQVIRENSMAQIKAHLAQAPSYSCVYSFRREGRTSHYRVLYCYLQADTGVILSAVQDVTEMYEKELRQRSDLAKALQAAEAANKAKTAFLSRVSHDMRTPLNGILGITTLMRDVIVSPKAIQDLSQLELSGKYLLNLINDTLDVSRIESGRMELHPTVCDSRRVVSNILHLAAPGMERKGITLHVEADTLPMMPVYVDEGRLQQVAMNILGNAVKFTPAGGTIELIGRSLGLADGEVIDEFWVKDNGIGMSKEFLPHLFDAFSQENAATTNAHQGTGLGMTITYQIVKLMGGEMTVESEKGKGTCVRVVLRLPIATEEQIREWRKGQKPHAASYNLDNKHVLLCEDHPLNTQIAIRLLGKVGVQVTHAGNGEEGVRLFAASAPGEFDAILMDIRMPVMDGLDATRAIRALPREDARTIPILAMTANALDEDVQRSHEAGMNAHLAKPIQPESLFGTLEHFLNPQGAYDRQRILVVDDAEVNRAVIRVSLEPDYEVFEAASAAEALEMLRTLHGMDAVITDIQMPNMDGFELIRRIRAQDEYRHMVLIANTQFETPGQEEKLLALGANDFIYKPANPEIVKLRMRNALGKL